MTLVLGLISAIAWAIHDICVRHVSQQTGVFAAFGTVLFIGAVLLFPTTIFMDGWELMTPNAYFQSITAGLAYAIAGLSLYLAFSTGPVRLVAPIIGSFPILSVVWAVFNGASVSVVEGIAVLAVVAGVMMIARLSTDTTEPASQKQAIIWAVLASIGFAATFALAQAAVRNGADIPVLLTVRVSAFIAVALCGLGTRQTLKPARAQLPLLAIMGALDALALAFVSIAGKLPHPEYASVTSSTFGMLTVILAWAVLHEPMSRGQWASVVVVFLSIGILSL